MLRGLATNAAAATKVGSSGASAPWAQRMSDTKFDLMRRILAAPSPVGLEAAMTEGVIVPEFSTFAPPSWKLHRFKGNAGVVYDTDPSPEGKEKLSVMVVGHADKIRMQVRSIGSDGKVFINSDSFLPFTLVGNEVLVFSEDPQSPRSYRKLSGLTVEALGAIHFASDALRTGAEGVTKDQLYLDLGIHGKKGEDQVKALGIRPGDSILLDRPIRRGLADDTFYGAYLDNGLGCFTTVEVARLVSERQSQLSNVRCLFAFAAYEEIGRFGSRVLASLLKPDVIIATDVNHDYVAAPNLGSKRPVPLKMGSGFTLTTGSVASESLNSLMVQVAQAKGIPYQRDMSGVDTGTDAMAGVLGSIDAAVTSVGFPIRNMHTVSELGHTGDVTAAIHAIYGTIEAMEEKAIGPKYFTSSHPRLDLATPLTAIPPLKSENKTEELT